MIKYLWIDMKLQFRIPVSIFFSLVFPLIMMFAMVSSYGNIDIGNGYHFIDKYFLISTGIGLLPIALVSFPIWLGESVQNDSYKRLEYFGLKTSTMVTADVLSYVVLTFMSIIVNILFAFFFYGLHIPSAAYFFSYVLGCLYCNLVLLMFGAIMALLVKNTAILMPLGMVVMFTCYILTGAFSSFEQLPESFQTVGNLLPIKYVMNDFFYVWTEQQVIISKFLILNVIYAVFFGLVLGFIFMRKKKKRS